MLFNLANAHERLGNYAEAAMALRGYIPHAPPAARQALEKRAARLDGLAQKERAVVAPATPPEDQAASIPVKRAVGLGLSGLGVLGLGLGTAFGIAALDQRSQLDALCEPGANGRLCPPEAGRALEKDETYSVVSDVSFIVGGVALATGIFLIVDSNRDGREVRAELGPSSLWLRGRF